MQLRKFSYFVQQVSTIEDSWGMAQSVEVFRRHKGAWFDANEKKLQSVPVEYADALSKKIPITGPNATDCVVPCNDLEAVVRIQFHRRPQEATRERADAHVKRCLELARDKYDALHDSLTGAPNRKSFEVDIQQRAKSIAGAVSGKSGSKVLSEAPDRIWLISLDLDHFKRVNDGYGHPYGDLVLASFYLVASNFCHLWSQAGRFAQVYRLGGEEFSIIVVGIDAERDAREFAELLRAHIANHEVPSEAHVSQLKSISEGISLPDEKDRRITTSIGVASLDASDLRLGEAKAVSLVKGRADRALYYAKSGGRNCVRFFIDILRECGSVLHFDPSVGVAVIDLGQEVGASKGHEFFVVPQQYTGNVPYMVDDGRSKRKLGLKPRLHAAVLTLFESQSEISFCSVKQVIPGYIVGNGDSLELIPLGTFGGLSTALTPAGLSASADKNVAEVVQSKMDRAPVTVACIRADGIEHYSKKFGVGVANDLLASMRKAAMSSGDDVLAAGFLELGLLLVARSDCDDLFDWGYRLSQTLSRLDDRMDFRVGLAVSKDGEEEAATHTVARAVLASRLAEKDSWAECSAQLLDKQAGILFEQDQDEDALLNLYDKAVEANVRALHLSNNAGIVMFRRGEFEEAERRFREARDFDPNDAVLSLNLATAQYRLDKFVDCLSSLDRAFELDADGRLGIDHARTYAMAAVWALKGGDKSRSRAVISDWLNRALTSPETPVSIGDEDLRRAMDELAAMPG